MDEHGLSNKVCHERQSKKKKVTSIGGGKDGAMWLQPHLILRVLHIILIFTIEIFSCQSISPTWFGHLPPLLVTPYYISIAAFHHSTIHFWSVIIWPLPRSYCFNQRWAAMIKMYVTLSLSILQNSYVFWSIILFFNTFINIKEGILVDT